MAINHGFFRDPSAGENMSMPARNIVPKIRALAIETIQTELKSADLSTLPGKNLIIPVPSPKLDKLTMIPAEEISAVASPTSSEEYRRAARIQKKKPKNALVSELSMMKNEFL